MNRAYIKTTATRGNDHDNVAATFDEEKGFADDIEIELESLLEKSKTKEVSSGAYEEGTANQEKEGEF